MTAASNRPDASSSSANNGAAVPPVKIRSNTPPSYDRTSPAPQAPARLRANDGAGSGVTNPDPRRTTNARRVRNRRADLILTVIAVTTGIAIGLGFDAQPWSDWTTPHSLFTALSRVAAMSGTAFALASLLLSGRIAWIERSVGQDRLIKWHRVLGPYSLYLILAHVVLVTVGYALADKVNVWSEFWTVIWNMSWMIWALVGFAAMMMIGVTSYRRVRGKLKYEQWWMLHLFAYLGVTLSFMHQIVDGTMFLGHPLLRIWWTAIYVATFTTIIWFRIIVPWVSSLYHGFQVERVEVENHNTISVIMKGRHLEELEARGGQFFAFRFLARRYWWESHPYSLSAAPRNNRLRITVKDLGDHSSWLRNLKPGTRVFIEGPYGVFTADQADGEHITLIAAGVGVTPIRALLEELPRGKQIDIVWRASKEEDLMLRDEVEALARWHNARLHYVVGSRQQASLDVRTLRTLVPTIKDSHVFLCGPGAVIKQAVDSCHALGVPKDRIHDEAFAF